MLRGLVGLAGLDHRLVRFILLVSASYHCYVKIVEVPEYLAITARISGTLRGT